MSKAYKGSQCPFSRIVDDIVLLNVCGATKDVEHREKHENRERPDEMSHLTDEIQTIPSFPLSA